MYCKFCGATMAEGATNCLSCGATAAASEENTAGTVNLEGAQAKRSALDHSYDKGAKYYTNDNSLLNYENENSNAYFKGSRRSFEMKPVQYTENIGGDGTAFVRNGKNDLPKKKIGGSIKVLLCVLALAVIAGVVAYVWLGM